jgi:uncharacterized protein
MRLASYWLYAAVVEFAIIAYNGKDAEAPARRAAALEAHRVLSKELVEAGNGLWGGAICDDDGNAIGTIKIVEFDTQEDFDAYYRTEPFVTENVWDQVTVLPFKTGPTYVKNK